MNFNGNRKSVPARWLGVGVREGEEIQPDAIPIKCMTQKLEATYNVEAKRKENRLLLYSWVSPLYCGNEFMIRKWSIM